MPDPKAVIAIGACGTSGGVFREAYNVLGGVDKVIPVDVYVPGCPSKPEAIIDGVVLALEKLKKRRPEKDTEPLVADLKKAREFYENREDRQVTR
ncbi:Formate hydrogenlyase subunit 7 [anaerobic digester metagenome]